MIGIMITLLMSGCASKVEVILLPKDDGSVGKVSVSEGANETLLDKAWQKVETKNLDKKEILTKELVALKYGNLLEAMPEDVKNYRVYFQFDSPEIAKESDDVFKEIMKEIKSNPILQIDVIGYSDRAGDEAYNKILSMKRANRVIELLKAEGVNNEIIKIDYYGEANPIIATADGVAKKENRRVEVTIK
jgi:outer membrane protein OmpA-like peptidoglycan-associated protein